MALATASVTHRSSRDRVSAGMPRALPASRSQAEARQASPLSTRNERSTMNGRWRETPASGERRSLGLGTVGEHGYQLVDTRRLERLGDGRIAADVKDHAPAV